ncbi:MAG TPA: histidine triad nucleotide-binding protein [Candidatus Babeliales bacterium]|nr:histidine triad nucleotide-binding protein [Candidatus Babeliales bacterium]
MSVRVRPLAPNSIGETMQDCIFCKIIAGDIPSKPILETDDIIVLEDIAPKAPIHYLIIPKKHVVDVRAFESDEQNLAGNMLFAAQTLSKQEGDIPFRLLVNNGHEAGQRVFHLHMHFLAGKDLPTLF